MANPKILEFFDNPAPQRDFIIEHTSEEFTSVCPMTGHPDFASMTIRYVADQKCVELKSLKLYYQAYRNEGIFYEAITNKICDHLAQNMAPRWLVVISNWKGRGGISSRITATAGDVPPNQLA